MARIRSRRKRKRIAIENKHNKLVKIFIEYITSFGIKQGEENKAIKALRK